MESAFGWTQVTRSDVAKATELLKGGARGVRDEIGFLALHQGFADRFFPGTSVLQTRLRYALFVPWQIREIYDKPSRGVPAERRLKHLERNLVVRLKESGAGVIGASSAGYEPAQPPSYIYWTALRTWGILNPNRSGAWASRSQILSRIDNSIQNKSTGEDVPVQSESLFYALPQYPANWTAGSALTFHLLKEEAAYLRERISSAERIAPGEQGQESLLSRLARAKRRPRSWLSDGFDSAFVRDAADADDRQAINVAHAASCLAQVGRAAYSALCETMAEKDGCETTGRYKANFAEIVTANRRHALQCRPTDVEALIGKLDYKFRHALVATIDWLRSEAKDFLPLLGPYRDSEEQRKGARARLSSNARELRAAWVASEVGNAEPLNYRWHRVGQLLNDLHGNDD